MLKILFPIIIIHFIKFKAVITILNESTSSSIPKCLTQILNLYFATNKKLLVNYSSNESRFFANEILKNVQIPCIINVPENSEKLYKQWLTDVIIILDEMNGVDSVLNITLWHTDTVFFTISKSVGYLKTVFDAFWSNKILNVYGFVERDGSIVTIYSFLPYGPKNCGTGDPIIVDTWKSNEFETGNIAQVIEKKIKNMNGCPVNVSVRNWAPFAILKHTKSQDIDGFEGKLMLEISRTLNFNAWFCDARIFVDSGSYYAKATNEVKKGRSDFAIGVLPSMREELDFSIPYSPMACYTYIVPTGIRGKQTVWLSFLLSEFEDDIWILIALSIITTAAVFLLFLKYRRHGGFSNDFSLLHLLSTIIGVSVKHPVFTEMKIFYLVWVYINLVLTSLYQSMLSSKLAIPTADQNIETLEQLLQSDLPIFGSANFYKFFQKYREEENIGRIVDRYVVTKESVENVVEMIEKERNITLGWYKSMFNYYTLLHNGSRNSMNMLKECLLSPYFGIVMKKYSPFTKHVNYVVDGLVRGGLIKHWADLYSSDDQQHLRQPVMKLTMEKLKGIFFFWMGGLLVSILIFLGEKIYYGHFNSKKIRPATFKSI